MMKIVPLELKDLNKLVTMYHRHHRPVQGHRFSLGIMKNGELIGGCSVGRPVARRCNPRDTLEVTRLVVKEFHKNACSMLYARSAKIARLMGYRKIQTYILDTEQGTSIKASGWTLEVTSPGGQWLHTDGHHRRQDQPTCPKQRWARVFY